MRTALILALLISTCSDLAQAQSVQLNFGAGVGGILEEEYAAGRGQLYLGAQFSVGDRFSLGIELNTGGNLLPVDGTSTNFGNTEVLSPYGSRRLMAITKGFYQVEKSFGTPFVAAGAGLATNKVYVHAVDQKEVSKHNFVGLIELGVAFENGLTTSFKYISPSNSPSFFGVDTSGTQLLLEETGFSTLQLTLGYRFDLFSK